MSALFYFLIWAALIFLFLRFGCGAHVMGHGHRESGTGDGARGASEELRWFPPDRDVDPVCGKTIGTATSKPSVHDGHVYYFCSRECREIFEAAPEHYVQPKVGASAPQLEHSHV